jgi:hypothetical protein
MTRLDSAIRRLMAQRALLDWAAQDIASRPGLVLELGLGNGRTYDHLRERLPGRKSTFSSASLRLTLTAPRRETASWSGICSTPCRLS